MSETEHCNNDRRGDWFTSFTGRKIYPLDPRPTDVCIEDIAHALSNICRFGGHCKTFYSVAQHSVHIFDRCEEELRVIGLLHDASEAYVGDMLKSIFLPQPPEVPTVWNYYCTMPSMGRGIRNFRKFAR